MIDINDSSIMRRMRDDLIITLPYASTRVPQARWLAGRKSINTSAGGREGQAGWSLLLGAVVAALTAPKHHAGKLT